MLSADTIVPDAANPQSFNRYSYVNNNPINFNDPSGHYGDDVHYGLTYDTVALVLAELTM